MLATQPTDAEWAEWKESADLGTPVPSSIIEAAEKSDTLNVLISHVEQRETRLYSDDIYRPSCITADGTGAVTTLVIHGRDEAGKSICVNAHNFYPYFYASCTELLKENDANALAEELRSYIESEVDRTRRWYSRENYFTQRSDAIRQKNQWKLARLKDPGDTVISVTPEVRISCFDSQHQETTFFKITMRQPRFISKARALFQSEHESQIPLFGHKFRGHVFEAGVRFENRFMVDHGLVGGGWMGIPKAQLSQRGQRDCQTRSDREFDVDCSHVKGYDLNDPDAAFLYERPVTFRALSYDLECPPKKPHIFPKSEEIPIIQIGTCSSILSDGLAKKRTIVFTVGTSNPVPGRRVCCYATEKEMLNDYGKYKQIFDPDIVTGYNTRGFDDPYLCNRAYKCQAEMLIYCGRDISVPMKMARKKQLSNNVGNREYYNVEISGRVMYDMMPFIQDTYNPNSARLNYVAKRFLKEQKDDMGYDLIRPFFEKNAMTRSVLVSYCAKDAELPLLLAEKLMPFAQLVELSRVTGVQMNQIMGQGQTIRTKTLILREIKPTKRTLEYRPGQKKRKYKGALVAVPVPGYYRYYPVSVLDFSSLYPSIISGNNLCGSTFVPAYRRHLYKEGELFKCPEGYTYTRYDPTNPRSFRGILPRVLEKVLAKRKAVKVLVANAKKANQPLKQMVMTARELALKVVANSGYGFCGTPTSVYLYFVAGSTTAIGRQMITQTKTAIEGEFTKKNGYPGNAECVYGDTDSVMVKFGVKINLPPGAPLVKDCSHCDAGYKGCEHCMHGKVPVQEVLDAIQEVIELSHKAAEFATKLFPAPNKLEFENVYWPWLLLFVKKRYTGPFWIDAIRPIKTKNRGLEIVRGDHALAAREAQEMVINYLLYRLDPMGAVREVRKVIYALKMGKMDMSKLVTSRKLNKAYNEMSDKERAAFKKAKGQPAYKEECDSKGVYSVRQPHSELCRKLEKRTGKGYDLGERVPFIITRGKKKGARVCDRAEDPMYALINNIPIDTNYYLTDLLRCVVNVLAPVFEDELKEKLRAEKRRQASKVQRIDSFFTVIKRKKTNESETPGQPEATGVDDEKILPRGYEFGDLTRKMILDSPECRGIRLYKHVKTGKGKDEIDPEQTDDDLYDPREGVKRKVPVKRVSVTDIVVVRTKCMGCGDLMNMGAEGVVCDRCLPRKDTIRQNVIAEKAKRIKTRDDAWDRCRKCQSQSVRGIAQEDLALADYTPEQCKEFTCDNFFHRQQARRDVGDIEDIVSRFSV